MRTRSTSKQEPFLMLDDDRRTPRLAHWGGGKDSTNKCHVHMGREYHLNEYEVDR